jgi:hypothetical protein
MLLNADHLKADLAHRNERDAILFKIARDPASPAPAASSASTPSTSSLSSSISSAAT